VTDWQLQIPFRSRSDTLADVAEAARELPQGESRDVARQIALGALVDGTATSAGELLDQIEKATPEQRRKMLDDARVKAGLPTTATVEAHRRVEMASHAGRIKAATDHRPIRLGYSESGAIIDLNERDDDIARERAREESLRRIREDQLAVRAVDAAEKRANDEASAEWFRGELPDAMFPGG
jgi:hypothetical protein